jgi:hypothetical protein
MSEFEYWPASNPAEDDELRLNGTPYSIQLGSNGVYTVNEEGYDVEGDEDTFWVRPLFVTRSLPRAKTVVLDRVAA